MAFRVVRSINLDKYLGTWYQLAANPQSYEPKGSYNVKAVYTKEPDGTISVVNSLRCRGETRRITGTLSTTSEPGRCRVRLEGAILGLFAVTADYIIKAVVTDAAGNYLFAIVGGSNPNTCYVLSRRQVVSCEEQQFLIRLLRHLDYDWDKLNPTAQNYCS